MNPILVALDVESAAKAIALADQLRGQPLGALHIVTAAGGGTLVHSAAHNEGSFTFS